MKLELEWGYFYKLVDQLIDQSLETASCLEMVFITVHLSGTWIAVLDLR